MNKVITINLGGMAFQLEDDGYDALRAYLETASLRLQANPDRDEILSDIERAIGDKLRLLLNAHKNVVLTREVQEVLAQMGEIHDDAAAEPGHATAGTGATASAAQDTPRDDAHPGFTPRRLYCVQDGAMLAGVCNGIGAYFGIDPTFVRLAFILLTFVWGTGLLVYLIMAVVIPTARSPEEKAAAFGVPSTAQEFIRRAKEGYYDAMKSFPDREARRAWKRKFRQEMRDWRTSFHREMAGNTQQWRENWQRHWAAQPGAGLALPIISVIHGAILIVWVCAFISLLASGTVLGVALPVGMPLWVAALILLIVYGMLAWPLKAARRAFYFRGVGLGSAPWGLFCLMDAFIWIGVVGALLYLAMHYFPEAREAARALPGVFHDAADSIRDWWRGR